MLGVHEEGWEKVRSLSKALECQGEGRGTGGATESLLKKETGDSVSQQEFDISLVSKCFISS